MNKEKIVPSTIILISIIVIIGIYMFISKQSNFLSEQSIPENEILQLKNLDSDNDGLNDFEEKELGLNPLSADTDGDGLFDWYEINQYGTSALATDTDRDGIPDGFEIRDLLRKN